MKLPEGYFYPGDIASYRELIRRFVPLGGVVVEIGCWYGRSICSIAKELIEKDARVHLIDTFVGPDKPGITGTPKEHEGVLIENLRRFGLSDRTTLHVRDSVAVAEEFERVDLVFVDGDHSYDAVTCDVLAWIGRTPLLSGHDFVKKKGEKFHETVRAALADTIGEVWKFQGRNSVWWKEIRGTGLPNHLPLPQRTTSPLVHIVPLGGVF